MIRQVSFLALVLLAGKPLLAGELDAEFGPPAVAVPPSVHKASSDNDTRPGPVKTDVAAASAWKASELDREQPTLARGGGGGGHGGFGGGGFGGGFGHGGFGFGHGGFGGGGFGGGFGGFGGYGRGFYGGFGRGFGGFGFGFTVATAWGSAGSAWDSAGSAAMAWVTAAMVWATAVMADTVGMAVTADTVGMADTADTAGMVASVDSVATASVWWPRRVWWLRRVWIWWRLRLLVTAWTAGHSLVLFRPAGVRRAWCRRPSR